MAELVQKEEVVILFAGDSGDGMQLTGNQFTNTNALFGNDVSTFPDFPAEIRAPIGTVGGVSGFQVRFGSQKVFTPGDAADVLVAMNAAALKANIHKLKPSGALIVNTSGFDSKNLKLAKAEENNPLDDMRLEDCSVIKVDVNALVLEALADSPIDKKAKIRAKNMFVLGLLYWMYHRDLTTTEEFIKAKFAKHQDIVDANLKVLRSGYYYGETSEVSAYRYEVAPAKLESGTYRSIMGNQAAAMALVAASRKANLELFYGSYPITPASDILHELVKHQKFGVKTFQAEDEIAAVSAAIGASFGGALGVTASSGPGIALKGEAIGLAIMLEIPLVIINVQRGGPSTGLPTKTEQADLMQAMYGRNGEAQLPVLAIQSPSDAFLTVYEACKIAVEYMTPVMVLSDGYIANAAEPWKFPSSADLPEIHPKYADKQKEYLPYKRDEKLIRSWAIPGDKGMEHRLGGLEKELETGNVSYDPDNHEQMVRTRAERVQRIANDFPEIGLEVGEENGDLLILGWGSTHGAIQTATEALIAEGHTVAHCHIKHINPLPRNLKELLDGFDTILVPEMNDGQLVHLIQAKLLKECVRMDKIKGIPFTSSEIVNKAKELLNKNA